ncbi:MAG: ABC transporter ATP-binding protein [Polyangiaceae bacterium]|nr:ABC transporter ATP-binding protein [Polyangiaceae bacterium]
MEPPVRVDGLKKVFGQGSRSVVAVSDISFDMQRGEVLALLGPNGAGKTTTVKMMCGLVAPTGGTIRIGGLDLARRARDALTRVGAVLEGSRNVYWRLTVAENLEYFATIHGRGGAGLRERIGRLLETVGLAGRRDEISQTLSRGMQQRLALACALVSEPEVLFLDEPTLGLDYESGEQLKGAIRAMVEQEGKSVLLTTHQMDMAQALAHRVGIVSRGEMIALDSVAGLQRLFSAGQYELRVQGKVTDGALASLARWGPRACEQDGHTTITLLMQDPVDLYSALDAVRPIPILSIREVKPDLEQMYVEMLKRGR